MSKTKESIISYLISVGDATSQLLNATVFFSLNANQSLSGRCYTQRDEALFGTLRKVINWGAETIFNEEDHCREAYLSDIARASKLLADHEEGNI
jgi:hypothetical protein